MPVSPISRTRVGLRGRGDSTYTVKPAPETTAFHFDRDQIRSLPHYEIDFPTVHSPIIDFDRSTVRRIDKVCANSGFSQTSLELAIDLLAVSEFNYSMF